MIRVAYILEVFPSPSEQFVLREIRALETLGLDVTIFALRRPDQASSPIDEWEGEVNYGPSFFSYAVVKAFCKILICHPLRSLSSVLVMGTTYGRHPRALLRALRYFPTTAFFARRAMEKRLGHFHAHFAYLPTDIAMMASTLSGASFSFSAHAWDIYVCPDGLKRKIELASSVFVCTQAGRAHLSHTVNDDIVASKIVHAYHGLDFSDLQCSPSERIGGPSPPPLRILSVGRLQKKKGLDDLIQACRMLSDRGEAFECAIVGEGPERPVLERLIQAEGLGTSVRLMGWKPLVEVWRYYHRSDIVVLPCVELANGDRDGIPNVLVEALACGVPVVTTDLASIGEVIEEGRTGLMVPQRDPVALVKAIMRLAYDPALRSRIQKEGRKKVEDVFDIRKNVEALVRHFDLQVTLAKKTVDLSTGYQIGKAILDYMLSLPLLIAALPLMGFIALVIWLEDQGNPFFAQWRVGRHGQLFRIFKLRTMKGEAAPYAPKPSEDDPSITRVGRFLRRTGLDELTQLINVLRGEMSLVGPRPEMPFWVEKYDGLARRRLGVKPGITGLWQIMAPKDVPIHHRLEYDLYYIRKGSLRMDLWILWGTLKRILGIQPCPQRRKEALFPDADLQIPLPLSP